MKKLVSFDLDMTLLEHDTYQITDSALKALERIRGKHIIVLATGRDMDNYYSKQFRDIIRPDAIIHLNGTKVTVDGALIYEHTMDKMLLERLLHFAQDRGYSVGVSIGDDDYYTHPEKVVEQDMERWKESGRKFKDAWELLNLGVKTLSYLGDKAGVADIEEHFPELKLPMFAGETGADIIEKTASKAEGLKRLCDYFNIPLQDTIAFGDSMNDIEIIRAAGIGIAMGNALAVLKEAADYVTTDIDDDGIWNACEHFGLFQ